MAIKYQSEYYDTENVLHEVEIYDDSYIDPVQEIRATVKLDYAGTDDIMECLRGQGLQLLIEADNDNKFEDLSDITDRQIRVVYIRGGVTLFNGWITPGGWFEDFVADKWVISLDVIDGLGLLEELSFVDNVTGLPFLGRKTMLETIMLALKRTGLDKNVNIDIGIFYDGLLATEDVLANAQVNMERYVEDDGVTTMSCDKVIRDLLEPMTACITSKAGEWFIWRPLRIAENSERDYFRYDSDGVPLVTPKAIYNAAQNLGSYINGFYPHHAGENQRIFAKSALGGFRINYKYGDLQSLLSNPFLKYDPNGPPDIPGWTTSGSIFLSYPYSGGAGVSLGLRPIGDKEIELTSELIQVQAGLNLEVVLEGLIDRYPPGFDATLFWQVTLDDGGTTYYMNNGGSWITTPAFINSLTNDQNVGFVNTQESAPTPVAGDVQIIIFSAEGENISGDGNGGIGGGFIALTKVSLNNLGEEEQIIEGEFHTFTREGGNITRVEDVKEVYTGDNEEDTYVGSIYKIDNTNTSIWNRDGLTDELPILGIYGTEIMRASQRTARVFTGTVYGYFEYISIITIDGLDGLFIPIKYSYDTEENSISAEFIEVFTEELIDLIYEVDLDYGKVVKPTIKG